MNRHKRQSRAASDVYDTYAAVRSEVLRRL